MVNETADQVRARHAKQAEMLKARMIRPEDAIRKRQHERSMITALLLGGFVVLVFAISIAKIKLNW
jgi:hypothetical protein